MRLQGAISGHRGHAPTPDIDRIGVPRRFRPCWPSWRASTPDIAVGSRDRT